MKKKAVLMILTGVLAIAGILTGCKTEEEAEPWGDFASAVAQRIHVSENRIVDSLDKALKEGVDVGDADGDIWPRVFHEIDVENLIDWYRNRPDGLKIDGLYSIRYYGVRIDLLRSVSNTLLDGLAEQVATDLGIDEKEITDVFHQVMRQLEDSRHKEAIGEMVSEGHITREQADRYLQWFYLRPESIAAGRLDAAE